MKKLIPIVILCLMLLIPLCMTASAKVDASKIQITIKTGLKGLFGYPVEVYNGDTNDTIGIQCTTTDKIGTREQTGELKPGRTYHPAVGADSSLFFTPYTITIRAGNLHPGAESSEVTSVTKSGSVIFGLYFLH